MTRRISVVVLCCMCSVLALAQDNIFKERMFSDLEVTNSVTKSYRDSVYVFHVKVMEDADDPQITRRYFWFYQGEVRSTVGNYSGKLLHGPFSKFDRKEVLLEKGMFSYGLKDGDWLTWYTNGNVAARLHWNKGLREGAFADYAANGAVIRKGTYRRDQLHGKLYYYTTTGEVGYTEQYRNGVARKKKEKKPAPAKAAVSKKQDDTGANAVKSEKKKRKSVVKPEPVSVPSTPDTGVSMPSPTKDKTKKIKRSGNDAPAQVASPGQTRQ